jgi:hypothetical protein
MKIKRLFPMLVIAMLALSACGTATATPPSAEEVLSSVNTVVALTSMVQYQTADSNVSNPVAILPTSTMAAFATATLFQPINTPTYSSYAASASACDGSAYVSDVTISDGTVVAPGANFTKTWRIQNTGTCTWNSNYSIIFSSGERMSGTTTTIDQSVAPDETGDISVELTAPDTDGTYTGYWILSNNSGTAFGNYVYVQIIVSASSSTSTPTPTATTASVTTTEPTSTSTTAPRITSTVEPTIAPTEESISTPES